MPDVNLYRQVLQNSNFSRPFESSSQSDNFEDTYASFNHEQNCFLPSEFNTFLHEEQKNSDLRKGFSCLHLNCRSIKRNIDKFINFLGNIELDFCAIGVTETWLTTDDLPLNIDGYKFIGNSRHGRRGGGVGAYIRNDFNFVHRSDLDVFSESLECIFIEINLSFKNIIFSVIYRPPNSPFTEFLESLTTVLNKISKENKFLYFSGDFNLNLLNADSSPQVCDFLDAFITRSIYPLIHSPTRVTNDTATLIDNIFTNTISDLHSGIFLVDVSDHFPVYCIHSRYIDKPNTVSVKRKINDVNICTFIVELEKVEWNNDFTDPNRMYNTFLDKFLYLYDKCFPKTKVKHKRRIDKPWFNNDLRIMCNKKYLLYKKFIKKSFRL